MNLRGLLTTPKVIVVQRVRQRPKRESAAQFDIPLAVDGLRGATLDVFVRLNVRLIEDFSIGLRYWPQQGRPSVLVRWNGNHGPNPHPGCSDRPHVHLPGPAQLELAEVPRWPDGPPDFAFPLSEGHVALPVAWRDFLVATNIIANAKVDAAICRLYPGRGLTGDLFEPRE